MFLLFNRLSRFVIAFLPRSKHLLISWLQSPSAVILEPKKRKSVDKVMSLLFDTLSTFVIAFDPRSECLLISRLQSTSAVILEPKK